MGEATRLSSGLPSCVLCDQPADTIRAFFHTNETRILLSRCPHCRCEYLSPRPPQHLLSAEYRSYFERRHAYSTGGKIASFKLLLSQLSLPLAHRRILDVGSGEGDLVRALTETFPGVAVTAVDAAWSGPTLPGCRFYSGSIESWLSEGCTERFDAVFLLDVLEHLVDPRSVLCSITERVLKPGGFVVATFPNVESLGRRLFGRYWVQYKLEHLTYFSRESVEVLGRQVGLRTQFLTKHWKTLPVGYLISVGSGFGPAPSRRLSRLVAGLLPESVRGLRLSAPYGEWLWLARRNGDGFEESAGGDKL